ncbi:hypothetical protein ACFFKZ_12605 [Neisseria gonorrhoeae]
MLESVVGGERFGRYSFIGLPCSHYLKPAANTSILSKRRNRRTIRRQSATLYRSFPQPFKTPEIPSLPRFTAACPTSVTKPSTISNTSPTA